MANYGTASGLYDIFGQANIYEWANMQELATTAATYETEIQRRITASLTYATEDINDLLRHGPYVIPFTVTPPSIERCCYYKAGCWLFEWRRDKDEDDRYSRMEAKADLIIEQIKRGIRQLDSAVYTIGGTRGPGVVV